MYDGLSPSAIICLKVFRVKNRLSNIEFVLSTLNTYFLHFKFNFYISSDKSIFKNLCYFEKLFLHEIILNICKIPFLHDLFYNYIVLNHIEMKLQYSNIYYILIAEFCQVVYMISLIICSINFELIQNFFILFFEIIFIKG